MSPLIYDESYIPFLLDYCRNNEITAIISLFDVDLPILANHKEIFEEAGIKVIVSEPDIVEICNDKWKTYQFLRQNGFHVPKTFLSFEEALKELKTGKLIYPVMVKPRWGMGSIAIYEAENEAELRILYNKVEKEIMSSYLKYESSADFKNSVLIQEKIEGQEHGLDIINDLDGNYVSTVVKKKIAMRAGETDCAIVVKDELAQKTGEKLSRVLHHVGNLDVDVFKKDGIYYVLEMNARFGGGYPFSHMAGVNLPLAIVKWLAGETVDKALLTPQIGVMAQKDLQMVRLR